MKRTTSTKVMWRTQYRLARDKPWKNAGLFETRANARDDAAWMRTEGRSVGFGNTRVVRFVKGEK